MIDQITVVIAVVFVLAGLTKGIIGLGLPTISMGLLAIVMTPAQAAARTSVPKTGNHLAARMLIISRTDRLSPVGLSKRGDERGRVDDGATTCPRDRRATSLRQSSRAVTTSSPA